MQNGVGGVSPFTCGYIPNAISFSFANIYGGNVDDSAGPSRRRPRTRGASTTSSITATR